MIIRIKNIIVTFYSKRVRTVAKEDTQNTLPSRLPQVQRGDKITLHLPPAVHKEKRGETIRIFEDKISEAKLE